MKIFLILVIFIIIILITLIYISKNILKVTKYVVKNSKIPNEFNNLKIVHIGDVHSKTFGKNNKKVINLINNINPDIIVMSGDIVDKRENDIEEFISMYQDIYEKYPTYYSIGNHERSLKYDTYKKYIEKLNSIGVHVIINENEKICKNNEYIVINALKFKGNIQYKKMTKEVEERFENEFKKLLGPIDNKKFNILITHDPENFKLYQKLGVDLIFSGHVHGGLIRIGNIGLLSPRRKFFPKYSYGKYVENGTTLIVTSGMGNATIPIRLFNRPEIVEVKLLS